MSNASRYVGLAWDWQGPTERHDGQGNTWWEIRIRELPDFLVAEESPEAARAAVAEALEAFIDSYLSRDETPPRPAREGTGVGFTLQAA
jgi:predicted RNase H-like HicB family nuclease